MLRAKVNSIIPNDEVELDCTGFHTWNQYRYNMSPNPSWEKTRMVNEGKLVRRNGVAYFNEPAVVTEVR